MKTNVADTINELTLAEASAWLTRLQESDRTPAIEAAFKEWLAASSANARAFTRVNDVWELIPGAIDAGHRLQGGRRREASVPRRRRWIVAAVTCAALLLVVVGVAYLRLSTRVYQTAVGDQQTVLLEDSTRVTLNTDTRIVVAYRSNERHVVLERGEALFEVAKNPDKPFVVQTDNHQVVALGTMFDVRRDPSSLAVALIEGKVKVSAPPATPDGTEQTSILAPGERLTFRRDGTHVLDRPRLDRTLAWQHGVVDFDDVSLAQAAADLNRYGKTSLTLADPSLEELRVSGVFSTRDPEKFASAVAALHGLRVKRTDAAIELLR